MPLKIFISYSHDSDVHRERILGLSERLRQDGFETELDRYVNGTPESGWPRWMLDGLDAADFVLVVCTETYHKRFRGHETPSVGKGVTWEGAIITQELYDNHCKTTKFVPLLFDAKGEPFIPEPLRHFTRYLLNGQSRYLELKDFLLGVAGVEPGEVGVPEIKCRPRAEPMRFPDELAPKPTSATPSVPIKELAIVPTTSVAFSGRASTASTLPGFASDFYTEPTPGLLDDIERSLRDNGVTFLHGPPGSGKSMTASEVAERSGFAYRFWLNAENELTLIDSLAAAQRELLKLKVGDKDDVQSFARGFLEALPSLHGWLLIYDNVADQKLLGAWLPRGIDKPAILITTQNHPGNAFAGRQIAKHELDELEENAALLFFLRRAGHLTVAQTLADAKSDDRAALYRLFADLGRLPLALEAAAHVCSKGVSIRDYHRELTQTPQPRLWGDEDVTTATRHPGLHRSLTVLFDRVKSQSPEAFEILMDAAWLEPDRVPTWLLPQQSSRALLMLSIDRLLVPVDGERTDSNGNDLRRIHREHQFHLRGMLNETSRRERLEKLIDCLRLPTDLDFQLWRTDRNTGRRFEGTLSAIVRLSEWANRLQLPSETQARLQHAQAVLHYDSANHGAAEHYCRDALDILGENNLTNTVLFASLQQQLAVVLATEYRSKDALVLLDDSLNRLDALGQSSSPYYAVSLSAKAGALLHRGEKGDIEAALALLDEALRIQEASQRKSHPNYAGSLSAKAGALLERGDKGDVDAALDLLDQALRITELSQGKSHPGYAGSLHALASALLEHGEKVDINAALALLDEALHIKEASQGKGHPSYAAALLEKARVLLLRGEKGDINAALAFLDEDLRITALSQGKSHPSYAISLLEKAHALSQLGEPGYINTALALLDEALSITETSRGKSHPDYAVSLHAYARLLLQRREPGDINAALALLDDALCIAEASKGTSHSNYAVSLHEKAVALLQRGEKGDLDEALTLLDKDLQLTEASLGKPHHNYAVSLHEKARALLRRGEKRDIEEALALLDEALHIKEAARGKSHASYAVTLLIKGDIYLRRKQGADLRRAGDLFDEAWRILKTTRGDRHLDTANALFRRGEARARQGKTNKMQEGLSDMDEAIRITGELFPDGHPIVANFLNQRASLRRALGQHKGAAADESRATEISQKFGHDRDNA